MAPRTRVFISIGLYTCLLSVVVVQIAFAQCGGTCSTSCVQPARCGQQPNRFTIAPTFDNAATNSLGSSGPTYSLATRGVCPNVSQVAVSPSNPIPSVILKAMGWQESSWRQFDCDHDFADEWDWTYIGGSCDYGIMQVVYTGTTTWFDPVRLAGEIPYNIGTGTNFLIKEKWNWLNSSVGGPCRQIGAANHVTPEELYYAVTAYNRWDNYNDPNNKARFSPERPPYRDASSTSDYPYQERVWGWAAHPDTLSGQTLWTPQRIPWVPRGTFSTWQADKWQPAVWTPRPSFYYLPEIKANLDGWSYYIAIQNPRSDYTLAVDIAFYNSNGTFNQWWLDPPRSNPPPYIRLAPLASRVIAVTDRFTTTFTGSAVIAASQDVAVSVIRVHQGSPYASAIYNAIESPSNTAYLPLLHRNNNYWNSEIIVPNAGSQAATVTVSYYPYTGNTCSTTPVTIASLGSYTFDLKNNPGCNIGTTFIGAAKVVSDQPIAVVSNQLRADASVNSLMSYEGFPAGAVTPTLFAPMLMNANSGWDTGVSIYNRNDSANSIQIEYKEQGGSGWTGYQTVTPAANGVVIISPAPPASLNPPTPFIGSAVLTASAGKPAAAIVNETKSSAVYPAMCYGMATQGGRKFVLPLALKDKANWLGRSSWYTGLMVQNLSATSNAIVTVTCYNADGTQAGSPTNYTVSPRRSQVVSPLLGPGSGFLGSAIVTTADQDVAVAVNHTVSGASDDAFMSHNGIRR